MAKFNKVGAGWNKTTKSGERQFISIATKSKDSDFFLNKNPKTGSTSKSKLWLELDGQEPVPVTSLSLFPNEEIDFEKYPSAPQYSLLVSTED